MKGRGTRVLSPTDLKAVSGEEAKAKTHFVIVDAVGVCESDKTESRPLERKPGVSFGNLLTQVAMNDRSEDTLTSLASRLARLDRAILPDRRAELSVIAGGKTLAELSAALLRAFDPDAIAEAATGKPDASPAEVDPAQVAAAQQTLLTAACGPFDTPELREALAKARQELDQTIDVVTVDKVIHQGFDNGAKEKAAGLVAAFRAYLEAHKEEIAALQILYSRPYAQRLTEPMLKELEKTLRAENIAWNEETLWNAFAATRPDRVKGRTQAERFADLIPLGAFCLGATARARAVCRLRPRTLRVLAGGQKKRRARSSPPTSARGSDSSAITYRHQLDHRAGRFRLRPFQPARRTRQGAPAFRLRQLAYALLDELNEVLGSVSTLATVKSGKLFTFVTSGSRGWAKYYSELVNGRPAFLRVGNLDHDSISLDLRDIQRVNASSWCRGIQEQESNYRQIYSFGTANFVSLTLARRGYRSANEFEEGMASISM